ncbi:hypothetical protein pdam_00017163 [Pocillopora damicornis]|uniref:Uncharacterized protein n=1 Tax=Pocillopora damicornis TaxID=46731 RepID=A0A3M6UAE2_POCDA|nr:hypothetical protein pdam_00017163 [Pocillopora damicornis]
MMNFLGSLLSRILLHVI